MANAFEVAIHARWPDMDQNGHMRTVAYLEVAEDSRMQYFASRGYSMGSFVKHRIGPVVSRDELQYRAELRLMDPAVVRLELAGISPDGARFRLRNTIVRADGPLGEPEDAAVYAHPVAAVGMEFLVGIAVANLQCLRCGEVAALRSSEGSQVSAQILTIDRHDTILYGNLSFTIKIKVELKFSYRFTRHRGTLGLLRQPS